MKYIVVLKSMRTNERIVLCEPTMLLSTAEGYRKLWRRLLGGKAWTVDRRPGLDTLSDLALTIEKVRP